jgi:hypothetical protein
MFRGSQQRWECVLEHIEKMDTLIALANSQGDSVPDRTRVAYIIGSLQKAHHKNYEKDLEEAERGNYTLPWLIQRLSIQPQIWQ